LVQVSAQRGAGNQRRHHQTAQVLRLLIENRAVFERAGQTVMAKIMENDKAAAALPLTGSGAVAIPTVNAPDFQKQAAKPMQA
jgi:limonene 1,2-monooxygenase